MSKNETSGKGGARSPGLSRRRTLTVGIGILPFAFGARADTFPSKNFRLVVPFPAGGSADVLARLSAEEVGPRFGQRLLVESRPGAGGNIAAQSVVQSEPDGNSLLVAGQAIMAINKPLYKTLSYDPQGDFTFISMMGAFANVLLVNPTVLPVKSISELITFAKKSPEPIAYGSNGIGSVSHLTTEVMAAGVGMKLLHVPYRGAAAGLMSDVISARVAMTFTGTAVALPLVESGQLRALAVSTPKRIPQLPDVPTLLESGFESLNAPTWFALFARATTPPAIIARLRREFAATTEDVKYGELLGKNAMEPFSMNPEQFESFFAAERRLWSTAVEMTGAHAG